MNRGGRFLRDWVPILLGIFAYGATVSAVPTFGLGVHYLASDRRRPRPRLGTLPTTWLQAHLYHGHIGASGSLLGGDVRVPLHCPPRARFCALGFLAGPRLFRPSLRPPRGLDSGEHHLSPRAHGSSVARRRARVDPRRCSRSSRTRSCTSISTPSRFTRVMPEVQRRRRGAVPARRVADHLPARHPEAPSSALAFRRAGGTDAWRRLRDRVHRRALSRRRDHRSRLRARRLVARAVGRRGATAGTRAGRSSSPPSLRGIPR